MSIVKEKVVFDERGMIIGKTVDVSGALANVDRLKDTKAAPMAEGVCIGSMDAHMFYALAQKAGVRLDDSAAMDDFATRLFQGGRVGGIDGADYSRFRVYEGTV